MVYSCSKCHKAITEPMVSKCDNRYWHSQCLQCQMCGHTPGMVGEQSMYMFRGSLICKNDYMRINCVCKICSRPLSQSDMVVKAHGYGYMHDKCVYCGRCQLRLETGARFMLTTDQMIVCQKCIMQQHPQGPPPPSVPPPPQASHPHHHHQQQHHHNQPQMVSSGPMQQQQHGPAMLHQQPPQYPHHHPGPPQQPPPPHHHHHHHQQQQLGPPPPNNQTFHHGGQQQMSQPPPGNYHHGHPQMMAAPNGYGPPGANASQTSATNTNNAVNGAGGMMYHGGINGPTGSAANGLSHRGTPPGTPNQPPQANSSGGGGGPAAGGGGGRRGRKRNTQIKEEF